MALYQGIRQNGKDTCRLYRWFLVCLALLSIPGSLALCIVRAKHGISLQIAYICVSFGIFVIVTGLSLFALLINKQLKSHEIEENTTEETQPDASNLKFMRVLPVNRSVESVPITIALKWIGYSPLVTTEVTQRDRPWSLSSANDSSVPSQAVERSWSMCPSVIPPVSLTSPRTPSSHSPLDRYIVSISPRDKSIMQQILCLTIISTSVGLIILTISTVFSLFPDISSTYTTLALLTVISILEIAVISIIGVVFTLEIKVKEKENLQFVAELARKLKDVKANLYLDERCRGLNKRFRAYLGVTN